MAPINSQAAASLMLCVLDHDDNQKARKDSLMSDGRLALCSGSKILLAFISRAAGSIGVILHHEIRPLKKRWFGRSHSLLLYIFSAKDICTISVTFFCFVLFCFFWGVRVCACDIYIYIIFLFQTMGRVIVPDIIFRDRTCLVFCFLCCVVKFQAREAIKQLVEKRWLASWQWSLCAFCLSFFLFFFFPSYF